MSLRLTPEEAAALDAAVTASGRPRSDLVREVLLAAGLLGARPTAVTEPVDEAALDADYLALVRWDSDINERRSALVDAVSYATVCSDDLCRAAWMVINTAHLVDERFLRLTLMGVINILLHSRRLGSSDPLPGGRADVFGLAGMLSVSVNAFGDGTRSPAEPRAKPRGAAETAAEAFRAAYKAHHGEDAYRRFQGLRREPVTFGPIVPYGQVSSDTIADGPAEPPATSRGLRELIDT